MNVIKAILLKLAKSAVLAVVDEALVIAVKEANEEIEGQVTDETQQATLKSAIKLVESKVRELVTVKLGA